MIKAEEAREITEESKANINVSSILDELEKEVKKNASNGLSKVFIMKTVDQLTKESKTVHGNLPSVVSKLGDTLKELGYDVEIHVADKDPSSAEYRYKIEVSW